MAILTANCFSAALRMGLVAAGIATAAPGAWAQAAGPDYKIKAVFLYHFAQFVEWPGRAFSDARSPLIIGVLGNDPFGSVLEEAVRGEKANGRALVVRRFRLIEEVDACHILFISRSEVARLEAIFQSLRAKSVLTVGDMDNFARDGGMIHFAMERDRIRLRVNVGASTAAGLTISSKLLRSVDLVGPEKK